MDLATTIKRRSFPTLQAPVGPHGEWETWLEIRDPEAAEHAAKLVAKAPRRWRIVEAGR